MKHRRTNGRGSNGEARTHELLERIAREISSMRKEISSMRKELKGEIRATNERIDRLIDILAPKLKDHEDRLTRLEQTRAA